jgi:hypothetical protein
MDTQNALNYVVIVLTFVLFVPNYVQEALNLPMPFVRYVLNVVKIVPTSATNTIWNVAKDVQMHVQNAQMHVEFKM